MFWKMMMDSFSYNAKRATAGVAQRVLEDVTQIMLLNYGMTEEMTHEPMDLKVKKHGSFRDKGEK